MTTAVVIAAIVVTIVALGAAGFHLLGRWIDRQMDTDGLAHEDRDVW